MSEQYLVDLLREAPQPRSERRARYFWPVVVTSAIFVAAGIDQAIHEGYLAGGFLIFVGVWSFGAALWLDGTR